VEFLHRLFKALIRRGLLLLSFLLSLLGSVRLLWANRATLRSADHIILLHEGGFGHTLLAPDAGQRLFPGKKIVVLVFQKPYHNPQAAQLFPRVRVLYLPFTWSLGLGSLRGEYCPSTTARFGFSRLVTAGLRRLTGAEFMTYHEVQANLVTQYTQPAEQQHFIAWQLAWYRLREQTESPPARLSAAVRDRAFAAVEKYTGVSFGPDSRLCCLYLRCKGEELTSVRRKGASLAEHMPAISLLIRRGYTVLLTGDQDEQATVAQALGPRFVTAAAVGIESDLFRLFAATEANIWVGNNGGGASMPVINNIPMLILDMFPFGVGYPNAWLHYKNVFDAQGHPVHYETLLRKHSADWQLPEYRLGDNTSAEILAAVESFLDELGSSPGSLPDPAIHSLPGFIFEKACNCRLSTPWLERHGGVRPVSRAG
jgi:putative glycosyltransferase (TIGR04372 family)